MKTLLLCVASLIGCVYVAPRFVSAQVETIEETSEVQEADLGPATDPLSIGVLVIPGNEKDLRFIGEDDNNPPGQKGAVPTLSRAQQAIAAAKAEKAFVIARELEVIARKQSEIAKLQRQLQSVVTGAPETEKKSTRAQDLERRYNELRKAELDLERQKSLIINAAADRAKANVYLYQELAPLSKEALEIQFDADIAKRRMELSAIKKRVEKMEATLEKRIADKDKIIDLRFQVIQNDAQGLGWSDQR